jgi:hypothetical protein
LPPAQPRKAKPKGRQKLFSFNGIVFIIEIITTRKAVNPEAEERA